MPSESFVDDGSDCKANGGNRKAIFQLEDKPVIVIDVLRRCLDACVLVGGTKEDGFNCGQRG